MADICGKHASSAEFYLSIAANESDEADSMTQGFLERMSPEQSHTATTSPR